ncbi:MAG TPA: gfo/Idh/MocA family oxidoreductase [Deltaproteobacteria bacterium]|nr:MAG: Gfo/Idh/MocA family oxidoreductase [Pseudomonadota bacterium]HBM53120.1 gfo/Idh/MocA family oxidoreductase [Deltaproteobacteria bacterium]|tara:strand:+ start:679 stop:1770 length:1092 start_codon:yes stop_codon:yes gene_type:complete
MKINVGIIGLGEVAQLVHLPILSDLNDKYRIKAVADISPSLNEFIVNKYNISNSYLSPSGIIKDPEIDAVFVLSPDQHHFEFVQESIKSGKHVFVEKPATLNIQQLKELVHLEQGFPNQITMVGYMRRYAGSFLRAKELIRVSTKKTEYLRFRDIICEGPFFVNQTRPIFSPADIPSDLIEASKKKRNQQLDSALGPETTAAHMTAYQMLTGLGCHSFSAVRELFGSPIRVKAAAASHQGVLLIIVLEYDGFLATYELVNNQEIVQFDATIEIYQKDRRLKINYESPYVRHQASTLELSVYAEGNAQTTIYGPDYKDPFVNEICEFYDCIASSRKPKTSLQDSLEDLELFQKIIETLKKSESV